MSRFQASCFGAAAVVLMFLLAGVVRAQELGEARVTLDGKYVFDVQAGYGAWSPELRASSMSRRIKQWADDPLRPEKITIQDNEATTDLVVDDLPLITVFDFDGAAAGMPRQQLARQWASSLENAVGSYRLQYAPMRIGLRVFVGFLALCLMAALLLLVRRAVFRAEERCAASLAEHARRSGAGLTGAVVEGAMSGWTRSLFKWLRWLCYALVILGALHFLLILSPRTHADALKIADRVRITIMQLGLRIWGHVPSLIVVLLIAAVAYQLVKFSHLIFDKLGTGHIVWEGFRPRWAGATDRLVTALIVVLALLIAYPYIPGSDSPAFQGVSIFLGALLSLGSTGLVGNALSGIMLTYMDGYQPGDYVEIGGTKGRVTKTTLMTTQLVTPSSEIVTLPNSIVMGTAMLNRTPGDTGTILNLRINVGYDAAWRLVEMLLLRAAEVTHGVSRTTEPFVLTLSLDQFTIAYELIARLAPGESLVKVRSMLARNVLDLFNEHGVQIMTPAFETNPKEAVIVPRDRWYPPPVETAGPAEGSSHPKSL